MLELVARNRALSPFLLKGDIAGWQLWNPSWAAADAEKLRQTNVGKVVEELYNKKK